MPQIDAEADGRGPHGGCIGRDADTTDGDFDVGIEGADLTMKRCCDPRKSRERIPPLLLRKRSCVSLRTLADHLKGLLALDAGDDADRAAGRRPQRPPLDVQFEVTPDGGPARAVREIGGSLVASNRALTQ